MGYAYATPSEFLTSDDEVPVLTAVRPPPSDNRSEWTRHAIRDTMTGDMATNDAETSPLPTHAPDGVDLTLIRWMLSLTPAERLQVLEDNVAEILRLRSEQET